MAFQDSKNLVDNLLDTQKKVMDNVIESTKKLTNGNDLLNETIEKGSDWYKNWLESQKNLYTKTTTQAETASETVKDSASKANEFYQNWLNTQNNFAKQIFEMGQESAKTFTNGNTSNPFANWQNGFGGMQNPFSNMQNPFANMQNPFNNGSNPFTGWMGNMANNNWMGNMQNANPFSGDTWKKATESMTSMFTEYSNMLNKSMGEFQKGFQNTTAQDAYKNMMGTGEGFAKFAEMWMPMFKSIQDKTFNMDAYKQYLSPELYKDFMDKFFGFMPEGNRDQMHKMQAMITDSMKQMSQGAMGGYNQMRSMMGNMNGQANAFGNINDAFSNWNNMMTEAAAPFTKMMTPTDQSKTMQEWSEITKRIAAYNIKNSELQYMVYNQGTKVMDKLAENIAAKVENGTEVTSMLGLYQEWLNISDKVYVSLFESSEYSQLMGEVAAMKNKISKDIELQSEKMLKDIPVATRSEMDEVYKTIYDLKKKVRQLEKMLELDGEVKAEGSTEEKAAKKATAKKA